MLTDMSPSAAGQFYGAQIPAMGMNITNITHMQKPTVVKVGRSSEELSAKFGKRRRRSGAVNTEFLMKFRVCGAFDGGPTAARHHAMMDGAGNWR
ncbi:hypothetical protein quinque_014980 [Culex quinquefasciatus]